MKKLLAILLMCMILTACSADKGSDNAAAEDAATRDYLNARVEIVPWPETPENGMPVFYDDENCIVVGMPGEGFVPFLYNIVTGERRELSCVPEEEESWLEIALIDIGIEEELEISPAEFEMLVGQLDPLGVYFECVSPISSYRYHMQAGDFLSVCAFDLFFVDTANAVIKLGLPGIWLDDGRYYNYDDRGSISYTINRYREDSISVQADGDAGFDYAIGSDYEFAWDTVAVIVYESGDIPKEHPRQRAIGFVDGYEGGGEAEFISIGGYERFDNVDSVMLCGDRRALAYSNVIPEFPVILADRNTGTASVLIWDGETMTTGSIEDFTNEEGFVETLGENMYPIIPMGVSEDGRYALFVEMSDGDLIATDLDTLETRRLITNDEVLAVTQDMPIQDIAQRWYGGQYINCTGGYHLKFVFE